jgi:DNA-binding NtrC family response regulator
MRTYFVLIGEGLLGPFTSRIREALMPPRHVLVVSGSETTLIPRADQVVILVDASAVNDIENLVATIRARNPLWPIVVISSCPTWEKARAAFGAGAADYLSGSASTEEISTAFNRLLNQHRDARLETCGGHEWKITKLSVR